jgi:hypothetical protein
MIKVIETNLYLDHEDNIKDHQSRVIEVESWDDFINEVKEAKCITRSAYLGSMYGVTIPRSAKVENLIYDDFHLACDVYNYAGQKTKKLCYKV